MCPACGGQTSMRHEAGTDMATSVPDSSTTPGAADSTIDRGGAASDSMTMSDARDGASSDVSNVGAKDNVDGATGILDVPEANGTSDSYVIDTNGVDALDAFHEGGASGLPDSSVSDAPVPQCSNTNSWATNDPRSVCAVRCIAGDTLTDVSVAIDQVGLPTQDGGAPQFHRPSGSNDSAGVQPGIH